jgi:hypothetical protein
MAIIIVHGRRFNIRAVMSELLCGKRRRAAVRSVTLLVILSLSGSSTIFLSIMDIELSLLIWSSWFLNCLLVFRRVRKLRKATVSFVMCVRPSAWNNSVPTWQIFMNFDIWVCFENKSRKLKFHWNLKIITLGYFTWRPIYICDISQNEKCLKQKL